MSRRQFTSTWTRAVLAVCGLLLAVTLNGCATNPVTGRSDFVLLSEDDEIAIGRAEHPKILQQYGQVEMPELQAYVQSVGERLVAHSHRPDLIYRFTVLDSAMVNAFALPGGYIYITRGMLAYLNSEAELAAVLGHEMGHVTARHAVRQHSAATATGIIGTILAAQVGVRGAQDLANVLGTAFVRGYGREHELESDRLGAEYLARAGYDPQAMLRVIQVLKEQELFETQRAKEEGREPRVYHGLFSTHPDNDRRLQEVIRAADQFRAPVALDDGRERFLKHIDGLVFGDSEREGVRRGRDFYHGELGFALRFPAGWYIENHPDRIVAHPPGGHALLQLTVADLNRRIPPREYLVQRLNLKDLSHGEEIQHQGLTGYTAIAPSDTPFGRRPTRVVVLYFKDKAYVFAGAAKNADKPFDYDREFVDTARSFHALTEQERALARPQRLRVVRAAAGQRRADLARTSPIPNHPEAQLRLINGFYPAGEPAPGQLLKIVE